MSEGMQAEIFMETLTEMLAEERARKSARILRQARAQADRFISRSFGDDGDGEGQQHAVRLASGLSQTT